MRLKDKVALVTGAAQGIGQATAIRFAKEGAHVVVCDVTGEGVKKVSLEILAKNRLPSIGVNRTRSILKKSRNGFTQSI